MKYSCLTVLLLAGMAAAQTTFTGIINDSNVTYDARSSGLHADGITDDSTAINNAIAFAISNHYGAVQLPCGLIKINSAINLTNRSGLTLRGCGSTSAVDTGNTNLPLVTATTTTIMCNTGTVCIDRTGSSRIVLTNFNIATASNYTNPSVVGVLDSRDNGGSGGGPQNPFCFSQWNQIDNVPIIMHHNQSANSNNGTIAVLNITSEHYYIDNSRMVADRGWLFLASNTVGVVSPYQTVLTGCSGSMTVATVSNSSILSSGTTGLAPVVMQNVNNIHFINVHVQAGIQAVAGSAFEVSGFAPSSNIYISAQIENFVPTGAGTALSIVQSIDHVDLEVSTAATKAGSGAWVGTTVGGGHFIVSNSVLRVMAAAGSQDLQLIQSSDITYETTSMDMYIANPAPAAILFGCIVRAPLLNDSDITVSPGSTYMLFDSTGMSFQGDLHVNGFLSKSGGAFRIDNPLDPLHKYLSHSFVE